MKKYILLLLVLTISIYGCAFNEEDVPDPKPAKTIAYSPIDENNTRSFVGKYSTNELEIKTLDGSKISELDKLYTSYLNGFINVRLTDDGGLQYNYGLQYQGYNNDNTIYQSDKTYKIVNGYTLEDARIILLNEPIIFNDEKYQYTVKSLQKFSNDPLDLDNDTAVKNEITEYSPKLCDPKLESGERSCTNASTTGALSYVGYYRVENLTCGELEYIGGTDFAGEMVATPSLTRLGQTPSIVDLPLHIKIQIKNNELKRCFLRTDEQESNVYLNSIIYEIKLSKDFKLNEIFEQVGLFGLKNEENETIRTTEIDFTPKEPGDYRDMVFGDDENMVKMRLKIIKQGNPSNIPLRKLDDKPYF